MRYPKIVALIPILVIIMLAISAMIPEPVTIMVALAFSFVIVFVQTLAVLKGDPEDLDSNDEIPEP